MVAKVVIFVLASLLCLASSQRVADFGDDLELENAELEVGRDGGERDFAEDITPIPRLRRQFESRGDAGAVPPFPSEFPSRNLAAYNQYFSNVPAVRRVFRKEFPHQRVPSMSEFLNVFNLTWTALSEAMTMRANLTQQIARCDALLVEIRKVIPNWVPKEGRDGLALWSGGALELARWRTQRQNREAGYLKFRALETNNLGLLFNGVNFNDNNTGALAALWRSLSREYVLGARGHVTVYFVEFPRPTSVFSTVEVVEVRKMMESKRVVSIEYVRMRPAASERMLAGTGTNSNQWDDVRYYGPFSPWASSKFYGYAPSVPQSMFAQPITGIVNVTVFRPTPKDDFVDIIQSD